jgi:hypothetical protein
MNARPSEPLLTDLSPLLSTVARLVSRGSRLSDVEIRTLLIGAGREDDEDAAQELRRWSQLLASLGDDPSDDMRETVTEALTSRGLPESIISRATAQVLQRRGRPVAPITATSASVLKQTMSPQRDGNGTLAAPDPHDLIVSANGVTITDSPVAKARIDQPILRRISTVIEQDEPVPPAPEIPSTLPIAGLRALTAQLDEAVIQARSRLLDENEPARLDARLHGTTLWAQWQWPANRQIDAVLVAWREDRYPESLDERGTRSSIIHRRDYEQAGAFRVDVGQCVGLYVRIFGAMETPNQSGRDSERWLYSSGADQSTWSRAPHPRTVHCRLRGKRGAKTNWLEITTPDGSSLPRLVVVRRAGSMPLKIGEGDVVAEIGGDTDSEPRPRVVELDVRRWPAKSVVRVFLADPADGRWVTIEGGRVEVS